MWGSVTFLNQVITEQNFRLQFLAELWRAKRAAEQHG